VKILIIGYGNPGRRDDGLGPALIEKLEAMDPIPDVTLDSDYQLMIEYSLDIAQHDMVIFVDAAVSGPEPYEFKTLEPKSTCGISTHSISAESLLALTLDIMSKPVDARLLAIRGYEFDMAEGLTGKAEENLLEALSFIINFIAQTQNH